MKRIIPALCLTLIIIGGAAAPLAASEAATCCFTNPRYSGQCTVTPSPDETCADILTYLNSQNSVGKAYCGNTTIRGGWISVTCEEEKHNYSNDPGNTQNHHLVERKEHGGNQ